MGPLERLTLFTLLSLRSRASPTRFVLPCVSDDPHSRALIARVRYDLYRRELPAAG